jgi:predicted O-linked N-acetylglucosamine transferase (SPINDLY family)
MARASAAPRARSFRAAPLAGRRLRLGYVLGDFRQHAVSFFIEQLFRHHDRRRVELFAYSNHDWSDSVTARIRSQAEHWLQIDRMADAAVRERIEADRIDVLVHLSGHTTLNRMGVFALRAAPVQAEYLGGLASSGLTEMDYWIGDAIVTPAELDSQFSERVWRLPRTWVSYEGRQDAPPPRREPQRDGAVTVGSFTNLKKLNPATFSLWARVLHALPEASLLLKSKDLADPGNRRRIRDGLAAHGIAPHRVELQDTSATSGWSSHMAYYGRLDVALDPVDTHSGATTTCDALWMGVPVITKLGDRMGSRMTATSLHALGHPEWIAQSDVDYVEKAVALARDEERRRGLRLTLRDEMARSPLCDASGLATSLEDAYAEMVERVPGRQAVPRKSA